MNKYNIPMELSAVFCFPGENVEQMWETIDPVDELKPSAVQSHILFPFPETDVFRISKEMGLLDDEALDETIRQCSISCDHSRCFSMAGSHPSERTVQNGKINQKSTQRNLKTTDSRRGFQIQPLSVVVHD